MAISFRQVVTGQPARAPTPADGLAGRGADDAPAVRTATELPRATRPGEAVQTRTEAAAQGAATPPEPDTLARAVEEANTLAESALRATNRSVTFGRDEESGRIVITIREKRNGEEVSRQIPPQSMLRLVEKLRAAVEEGSALGSLIDLDG